MSDAPDNTDSTATPSSAAVPVGASGRDSKGRFAVGNSGGPGRPRRPDLYATAAARASAEGVDLMAELWQVLKAVIAQAKTGDTAAAKLLFDRLSDSDPLSVHVTGSGMSDTERAARLEAILIAAETRRRGTDDQAT